jgi:NAD(P) transhydrogenase subunit beta
MTAMPQLVAVFNGFGGAASAVVAAAELMRLNDIGADITEDVSITVMASTIIGAVTLTGSFIAFGKLQGLVETRPVLLPARNYVNAILLAVALGLAVWLVFEPDNPAAFAAMGVIALALGVLLVIPIGGADMPVVIALLNSYSGLAAAATGFVLGNNVLIIAGSLVGASGLILTQIMTRAMNRSLANVMLGGFGATGGGAAAGAGTVEQRPVHSASAEDVALVLGYARSVIFVPGYGLAVAQAQHAVRELADELKSRGISVKYAVHPVAGRMPGHMNVLLAEANVPYDELKDLDEINSEFDRTDVAIVIGANDVTNPAARTDPSSPIYGMPILNVDHAASVVVLKRSMASGFAGVDNELFYLDRTMMFFGDARGSVESLVREVKAL